MSQDQAGVWEVLGQLDGVQAERRNPPAGVDQDRERALVGERDQWLDARVIERELLGAGVELDPARAVVEAPLGLRQRVLVRVDAAERDEQSVRLLCRLDHLVVGLAIAVGLVERERERSACAPRSGAPL